MAIPAISLLEKEFYRNDYYAIKSSTINDCYLYGIEYIPNTIAYADVFTYWMERYKNNVIIFADIEDNIMRDFDIHITLKGDEGVFEKNERGIEISTSIFAEKIKDIYQYIVEHFVETNEATSKGGEDGKAKRY
ncbi:MAG: hypothetical protein LBC96_01525 [Lachnospiraceae bacterium]|jgi:hypothetical protein|nr:hypothetical protein [Lachnospiraceae bacterium]